MSDDQLQTFDAPAQEVDSTSTTSQSVSLEDAFSQVVANWENTDTNPSSTSTTPDRDTSANISTTEMKANADGVPSGEPSTLDSSQTSLEGKDESSRELYERMLRERDAQIGLYRARLNQLSQQYQQIKEGPKEPDTPDKVKELKELYPEIAQAMEQMIEYKVGDPRKTADEVVSQKAAYVQHELNQIKAQQNLSNVLGVHPDLPQLINSGALYKWVNGLDPVAKYGAQYCIQYGTPNDVINLISTYKGYNTAGNKQSSSSTKESLVNKVVNAMGVPSNKVEPTVSQSQVQQQKSLKEAFEELAKGYGK